jgi:hypothetical protein
MEDVPELYAEEYDAASKELRGQEDDEYTRADARRKLARLYPREPLR